MTSRTSRPYVGFFDTIADMRQVYDRHRGHTALTADASGWRLVP